MESSATPVSDRLAAEGAAERVDELLWTTPEAVRNAQRYPSCSADAAQRMICMLDATPLDSPLTREDWEMLACEARADAETAYLRLLAEW